MNIIKYARFPLLAAIFAACASASQAEPVRAAVGAVDMREARVAVYPAAVPSELDICWKASDPESKTRAVSGAANADGRCEFVFANLDPDTEYKFAACGAMGSFKTKPDYLGRTPPPDFSFVVLGDNYINDKKFDPPFKTNGEGFEIFARILSTKPAFALWAGTQNVLRNADIGSESAVFGRLSQARIFPESAKFLLHTANYAVPNSGIIADASSAGAPAKLRAFGRLWANPEGADESSRAYSFSYADADFFVLDDFSNRANLDYGDDRPKMLGARQLKWLFNALSNSRATFKFIAMNTPIANPVDSPENFTFAAEERKALIAFLSEKKIEGVIMISARKNYGEITRLVRAGAYPIYDLTAAPLTARPAKEISEMNYFRVPSSASAQRSFAQVKIEGAEGSRSATLSFFDAKGNSIFSMTVRESELKKFE